MRPESSGIYHPVRHLPQAAPLESPCSDALIQLEHGRTGKRRSPIADGLAGPERTMTAAVPAESCLRDTRDTADDPCPISSTEGEARSGNMPPDAGGGTALSATVSVLWLALMADLVRCSLLAASLPWQTESGASPLLANTSLE